ncbi:MAG: response regulator transcription factor [Chloroflexi bacterium]|nr:response regulator transcription factor [Chloroflexota bacterium]
MTKILLVEDDPTLLETLEYNLQKAGYTVCKAADGLAALEIARQEKPDLVVLDLMLPLLDGLSVCRLLRQESSVPIIMLTARAGEVDKIVGLEAGADDYLTKPFSLGEFLARVRALLRRTPQRFESQRLEVGELIIDIPRRRVWRGDHELTLSPKEFELLVELARHRGMVLSRELLIERVWGYEYSGDTRTVDVHIRRLREKVESDPSRPELIQTVRSVGYRLEG